MKWEKTPTTRSQKIDGTIEFEAQGGCLHDAEFFLFTNNSTAKSCFYKGSSSSKKQHLCLLGDFKGKSGTNYHMIGLANKTKSGIKTCWWIEQLVVVAQREG